MFCIDKSRRFNHNSEVVQLSIEIVNSGFCGYNSHDILISLDGILKSKPDLIVLMVGSNDFLNSDNSLSATEYAENLDAIICKVKSVGVNLVLMTLPPCYSTYVTKRHPKYFFAEQEPDEKICQANGIVYEMSRKHGLRLVDINRVLVSKGDIGECRCSLVRNIVNSGDEDGLHLTAAGYKIIATEIYNEIKEYQDVRKIICLGDSITYGIHMRGAGTSNGATYPAYLFSLFHENN